MSSWLKSAGLALLAAGWLVAGAPAPANAFEAITGDGGGGSDVPSGSSGGNAGGGGAGSGPSADTDTRLAEAAQRYEQAVGVVVISGPRVGPIPTGTAWAIADGTFVTNAHVVEGVRKALTSKHIEAAFIAINKRPDLRLRIRSMTAHPRHGDVETDFEGTRSIGHSYDVGLLRTDGSAPVAFKLAPKSDLLALRAGERVAYLGFPMENLTAGNVNVRHPVATMQSGIITAVTDYWQKNQDPANAQFVRHNLGAAGGASGSPMFNADGEVVSVLSGGNNFAGVVIEVQGGKLNKEIQRVGNAAMVNFAQRADLIHDLLR